MSAINLDQLDKSILEALQGDLGDSLEPYAEIAKGLEVSEEEVIARVRRLRDEGVIRRLGAMIRHIEAGIGFNAMVVWAVGPDRIERVGETFAALPYVTHCYERPPFGEKGGTLFTMVHSSTEEGCMASIGEMSRMADAPDYEALFSLRELKKISMTYFVDEDQQDS